MREADVNVSSRRNIVRNTKRTRSLAESVKYPFRASSIPAKGYSNERVLSEISSINGSFVLSDISQVKTIRRIRDPSGACARRGSY